MKGFVVKLKTVIWDQSMRNSKPSDNALSDESFGIHVPNIGKGLDFYPLGKVVRADEEPSLVPYSLRKGSHYVQAPLGEWPRAG